MQLLRPILVVILLGAVTQQSLAVIVAGAKGGGNTANNTTAASVDDWANSAGLPAFPYFSNIIHYSDATGIYLGGKPNGDIWVLSARHVTNSNASLTFNSITYSFQQRTAISNSDIVLMRYSSATGILPDLPVIEFADSAPSTSQTLVMIGRGRNRVQDATTHSRTSDAITLTSGQQGYTWASQKLVRWGTNNMAANFLGDTSNPAVATYNIGSITTTGYSMRFDQPTNPQNPNAAGPWLTTNQAMGSEGDSGGGHFTTTAATGCSPPRFPRSRHLMVSSPTAVPLGTIL